MGRDEHRKKKNSFLAQTPKQQIRDGMDIEFSQELADQDDIEAQSRSKAASKRMKK
ncbi:YfhD family protein [Oceanobacillus sp. FSL H7-0719]|uniref:YfhD family protein n=1 Tax=Oceanobacillus sp. FSL H7-0719 TaxID=2954507 RepID=UPI0032556E90